MRDTALALGLGERIALIPDMADPRDLFGLLRRPVARQAEPAAALA